MPLKRYVEYKVWENYSASAGEISPEVDVSMLDRITATVTVSAATTVTMQYQVFDTWYDMSSITFSAAGTDSFVVWGDNPKKVRFKTSAACTITIYVAGKT
jgi:uncharacterized protein YcfL